jgi:hypothetical protein
VGAGLVVVLAAVAVAVGYIAPSITASSSLLLTRQFMAEAKGTSSAPEALQGQVLIPLMNLCGTHSPQSCRPRGALLASLSVHNAQLSSPADVQNTVSQSDKFTSTFL